MSKEKYIPRLQNQYNSNIVNNLASSLGIKNKMRIPKLVKISLNMGLGDAKDNKNSLKQAVEELTNISGQKAVITYSKKAISNFKLRIGDPVGVKVTLRGNMMYEFFDRFISVTSPRIRDFRGFSEKGFDQNGNYNFGITEQIVFPEIDYDKVNTIRGLNITIVTSTNSSDESYALLKAFGFPINDKIEKVKKEEALVQETIAEETAAVEETTTEQEVPEETPVEETGLDEAPEKESEEKK